MQEYITGDGRLWIRDSSGTFTSENGEVKTDGEMDEYCRQLGVDCVPSTDCTEKFQTLAHQHSDYGAHDGSDY